MLRSQRGPAANAFGLARGRCGERGANNYCVAFGTSLLMPSSQPSPSRVKSDRFTFLYCSSGEHKSRERREGWKKIKKEKDSLRLCLKHVTQHVESGRSQDYLPNSPFIFFFPGTEAIDSLAPPRVVLIYCDSRGGVGDVCVSEKYLRLLALKRRW